MRVITILVLIIVRFVSTINAYPIDPRPLRQLVMESEYIIVGYVNKTYERGRKDKYRVAEISVGEVLQGEMKKNTIELEFYPNMVCPSPPRYSDNTYVISFIDRDNQGKLRTHALSYGSKTCTKQEIEIYKARILEIQQILRMKDSVKQTIETVEWLVKCAENKTTSWEGTYELIYKDAYANLLSQPQKQRLKDALLNAEGIPNLELADLLYKDNPAEIDNFLLAKLKTLNEDNYWKASEFMYRLKHRNNTTQLMQVMEEFEDFRFDDKKKKEAKNAINKFIVLVE